MYTAKPLFKRRFWHRWGTNDQEILHVAVTFTNRFCFTPPAATRCVHQERVFEQCEQVPHWRSKEQVSMPPTWQWQFYGPQNAALPFTESAWVRPTQSAHQWRQPEKTPLRVFVRILRFAVGLSTFPIITFPGFNEAVTFSSETWRGASRLRRI